MSDPILIKKYDRPFDERVAMGVFSSGPHPDYPGYCVDVLAFSNGETHIRVSQPHPTERGKTLCAFLNTRLQPEDGIPALVGELKKQVKELTKNHFFKGMCL